MYLFKKVHFRFLRSILLSAFFVLLVSASSVICCKAATTGTNNVITLLNGGIINGFQDGEIKSGVSGSSFTIPIPPSKEGYAFKGWLQQGNAGRGPWGTPLWADGELVSRPATDICAKYLYPISTTVVKIARPTDCLTKVSPNVVRITIKEDGKYGGVDDYVSLIWSSEMNVLANSNIKCMMYAKIPTGYALSPATAGSTNPGTLLLSGTDYYRGTGEFQYYESTWFNGNGPQGYGLFAIKKIDKSLPDPTPANPLVIDIGYYNYTKCDGSAGTGLGNGTGAYFYNLPGTDYLTAIFDPNIYNITYDANGGVGAPSLQSYGYNVTKNINLTNSIPQKTGFTFCGWDTNPNAITPSYKSGYQWSCSNKFDTTLYAIWKLSEMIKIQSPKTIILDHYGIGEFKISASVLYGEIIIDFPSTIYFSSPNKSPIPGNISLSTKILNTEQKIALGRITVPSLTAGIWNTSFNIHYHLKNK